MDSPLVKQGLGQKVILPDSKDFHQLPKIICAVPLAAVNQLQDGVIPVPSGNQVQQVAHGLLVAAVVQLQVVVQDNRQIVPGAFRVVLRGNAADFHLMGDNVQFDGDAAGNQIFLQNGLGQVGLGRRFLILLIF